MPRRRSDTTVLVDVPLEGLDLDQDPTPVRRGPGRPRKTTAPAPAKPVGSRKITARTPTGRIASKQSMVSEARDEIEMLLTLGVMGWSARDPECAAVAEQQVPIIADRMVAIIARNDKVLRKIAETGILGDIVKLAAATLPVIKAVWQAHGPTGTGHGEAPDVDLDRYPAYAAG